MGHVLSLSTLYEMARVTLPTFIESLSGDIDRDRADHRLSLLAHRIVRRARIHIDVAGRERVPTDRAFVFMCNHQSHMDIPIVYATIPARTLRMVGKKELFRIPIWSRAMRAGGFIEIDRGNRERAIASLDRAAEQIRSGVSIWLAPEGSRSKTGLLGPLKKGGFHLAKNTGTPIVPMAICGTNEILPPGTVKMAAGRSVRVVFGAPIEVADRTLSDLMEKVTVFLRENNGKG